jgi:TRAP-type C4-dicarboxylate transport system permease small subunit
MGLLIVADVGLRSLGAGSLQFVLEAVEYCLLLSAFFGAPWILKLDGHVTVDFLVQALPARAARACDLAANLLGLTTSVILLYYMVRVGIGSHEQGMRVIKAFIFPEWWLFAVTSTCLGLVVLEFVLRIYRTLAGRRLRSKPAAL